MLTVFTVIEIDEFESITNVFFCWTESVSTVNFAFICNIKLLPKNRNHEIPSYSSTFFEQRLNDYDLCQEFDNKKECSAVFLFCRIVNLAHWLHFSGVIFQHSAKINTKFFCSVIWKLIKETKQKKRIAVSFTVVVVLSYEFSPRYFTLR